MKLPTRHFEEALAQQGFRMIAGIDEVGRGAWAGPLLAAAVILPLTWNEKGIRDSKLLSPKRRERLYDEIIANALAWSVGEASVEEIDARGLGWANTTAMQRALAQLSPQADYVLADGLLKFTTPMPLRTVVDGDAIEYVIAAASIVAKVTRDRMMETLATQLPMYGFELHRGYGTASHRAALLTHGISPHHRQSFAPIQLMLRGA